MNEAKVEKVFKIAPKKKKSPIRREMKNEIKSASRMFDEISEKKSIEPKSKDTGFENRKNLESTKKISLSKSVSELNFDPVRADTPQENPQFEPENILKVDYHM